MVKEFMLSTDKLHLGDLPRNSEVRLTLTVYRECNATNQNQINRDLFIDLSETIMHETSYIENRTYLLKGSSLKQSCHSLEEIALDIK